MIKRIVENEMHERAVMASMAQMPKPYSVAIGKPPRTPAQNRRYWGRGVLSQIAEQASVGGKKFSAEAWHEYFKRFFIGVVELPGGEVVGMSSADLSRAEFADFCAEVEAYAINELGVFFIDLRPIDEWGNQ